MKVKIKCETCGSENVRRNCDAQWNVEAQKWEICAEFDHFDCDDCGGECNVIEEEITT